MAVLHVRRSEVGTRTFQADYESATPHSRLVPPPAFTICLTGPKYKFRRALVQIRVQGSLHAQNSITARQNPV